MGLSALTTRTDEKDHPHAKPDLGLQRDVVASNLRLEVYARHGTI